MAFTSQIQHLGAIVGLLQKIVTVVDEAKPKLDDLGKTIGKDSPIDPKATGGGLGDHPAAAAKPTGLFGLHSATKVVAAEANAELDKTAAKVERVSRTLQRYREEQERVIAGIRNSLVGGYLDAADTLIDLMRLHPEQTIQFEDQLRFIERLIRDFSDQEGMSFSIDAYRETRNRNARNAQRSSGGRRNQPSRYGRNTSRGILP